MTANLASLQEWLTQGSVIDRASIAPEAKEETQRFLRFYLNATDTALLPLSSIQDVQRIPLQSVLPVPAVSAAVLGLYASRGEILWLVDLGIQLGFDAAYSLGDRQGWPTDTATLTVISLVADDRNLGLVVPQIVDIEEHEPSTIEQPSVDLFPKAIQPFLSGYLVRTCSPVLSAEALMFDPNLQA
jgi:positive phototaxis protein PixI